MEYNQEIVSYIIKVAITFTGGTNYHAALIIFKLFPLLYKTTILRGNVTWFKKQNENWVFLKKPEFEINIFRNELGNYIDYAQKSLLAPDDKDPDYENKYKIFLEYMTKLHKLQEKIYSRPFMLEVLKELAELYYDKEMLSDSSISKSCIMNTRN
jgi:hypothetical protein